MANYLPGSQDYIPKINWKPDLNFYDQSLGRLDTQYKQNWDKVNSVYGTLLNSPMLRPGDIARRDQFFKQAMLEIQKSSEQDLTIPQNVSAAMTIFQPLIDDQNITSDMAYTKQYYNERSRGEALRNTPRTKDNENQGEWDPIADRALDYWAEDYSKSDDKEALSFERPRFTPFYNAVKEGLKVIQDLKLGVKSTWSDGKYIYTDKNGGHFAGDVTEILRGVLGNDSRITQTYNTMAYVAYKDAVKSGAAQYGSEEAAENYILTNGLGQSGTQLKNQQKRLNNTKQVLNAGMSLIKDQVDNNPVKSDNPLVQQYLNWMQQKQAINQAEKINQITQSNVDQASLPGIEKRMRRQGLLGAIADNLLYKDLRKTATSYARATRETEMKADPYGEIAARFNNDLIKMGYEHDFKIKFAKATGKLKSKTDLTEAPLEAVPTKGGTSNNEDIRKETIMLRNSLFRTDVSIADKANSEVFLQLYNTLITPGTSSESKIYAKNQIDTYFGEGTADRILNPNTRSTDLNKIIPNYNSKRDSIFNSLRNSTVNLDMFNQGLGSKLTKAGNEYDLNRDAMVKVHNTLKENDQELKNYFLPKDRAWGDMFDELGLVSKRTFMQKVPPNMQEKASQKYDELYAQYQKAYVSSDLHINLKSYKTKDIQGLRGHIDANNGATEHNLATIDAIKGMDREGIQGIVIGNDPADKSNMLLPGTPGFKQAYDIIKNFGNDLNADLAAGGKSKKITSGDINLLSTAASDAGTVGFFIQPSEAWKMKYDGTAKAKGITFDPAVREGYTILYNKDMAPEIFNKFQPTPAEIIIANGPLVIKGYGKYGGNITLEKTSSGINTTGSIKRYFPEDYPKPILRDVTTDENGMSIAYLGGSLTTDVNYRYQVLVNLLAERDKQNREILGFLPKEEDTIDKKALEELENSIPGNTPDNTDEE